MRVKILPVVIVACIFFSSCEAEKPKCMVEVVTSYSGYGVDGQDLGSGTFTEIYQATEGAVFYETDYGKWLLNPENESKGEIIAEIVKIEESGATIIIRGEETVVKYGTGRRVPSGFLVDDGHNYEYVISISDYIG